MNSNSETDAAHASCCRSNCTRNGSEESGIEKQPEIAFTVVYLKGKQGYVGFVEELPGVNSQGRTIEEARANLTRLASVVFDAERARAEELLAGKDVVREQFRVSVPLP